MHLTRPRYLIALDVDDTLVAHDHEISPENLRWIQIARARGLAVTLATGRHRNSTRLQSLVSKLEIDVPVVTVNGGQVWGGAGGELMT